MMGKSFVVMVVAVVLGAAWGEMEVEKVVLGVPEEDRLAFLKFHADRGYQLATSGKISDYQMGLPDDFSLEVYQSLQRVSFRNSQVQNVMACIICWSNGQCADICDPGIHPY